MLLFREWTGSASTRPAKDVVEMFRSQRVVLGGVSLFDVLWPNGMTGRLPLSLLGDLILEKGFQQEDVYIYNMFVVLKEAADIGDLKV